MSVILAVDVMGGDHGIMVTIPACIKFLQDKPDAKILLVGDESKIKEALSALIKKNKSYTSLINNQTEIVHTTQVVEMDEMPQNAMRNKKDSSMRVALNLIKQKKAKAVVSAGNTGALMAIARYVLRTMEGIDRPAIAKLLPTIRGEVCVLDLGANVECQPHHLLQFAIMGSQLVKAVLNLDSPTVGLLNIGSEEIKGNDVIKKAAELLKISNLNFYGNVEGDDINKGTVDVVVCDGFTGNVALKTVEGVAKMISFFIKKEFTSSLLAKILGLISYPVIKKVKQKFDPRKYNGAILLGLNGLVIKSHGGADEVGFYYALLQAYHEVKADVVSLIENYPLVARH